MPPKKNDKASKEKEMKREKIVIDKTFGLKNKNKSKKVQEYVKRVEQSMRVPKDATIDRPTKKQDKQEKQELDRLLYGTDVLASQKLCTTTTEKIDIHVDPRDLKNNGGRNQSPEASIPRTKIICKYFIEAVEEGKYGWFWKCPNGILCLYRHAVPEDYVFSKSDVMNGSAEEELFFENEFEDLLVHEIEEKRAALKGEGEKVTEESFRKWKETWTAKQMEEKEKEKGDQHRNTDSRRKNKVSGMELFLSDPKAFESDDDDLTVMEEETRISTEEENRSVHRNVIVEHLGEYDTGIELGEFDVDIEVENPDLFMD